MAIALASYHHTLVEVSPTRIAKRKRSSEALQNLNSARDVDAKEILKPGPDLVRDLGQNNEGHGKKSFKCPQQGCPAVYAKRSRLEAHQRSHTDVRPFSCDFRSSIDEEPCTKTFRRKEHLTRHVKSAHTNERDHKCTWPGCDKAFVTTARLNRHLEAHDGQERYRCRNWTGCNRSFRKHSTLQRHIKVDHLGEKPYPCEEMIDHQPCGAAFDTTKALHAHQASAHSNGPRYWCDICTVKGQDTDLDPPSTFTEGFDSYSELQNHLKTVHPPVCSICKAVVSTRKALRAHVEIHHGMTDTYDDNSLRSKDLIHCPSCGKSFTKRGNMKVHVRSAHMNSRPFKCGTTDLTGSRGIEQWDCANACGKTFTSKQSLENHVRSRHVDVINNKNAPSTSAGPPSEADLNIDSKLEVYLSFVDETPADSHLDSIRATRGSKSLSNHEEIELDEITTPPFWVGGLSATTQTSSPYSDLHLFESASQYHDDDAEEFNDVQVDPSLENSYFEAFDRDK